MSTYSVKSGDSLSLIARDVLGDMALWPQIAQLNSISPPYTIQVGQVLQLPGLTAMQPSAPGFQVAAPSANQPLQMTSTGGILAWARAHVVEIGIGAVVLGLVMYFATRPAAGRKRRGRAR